MDWGLLLIFAGAVALQAWLLSLPLTGMPLLSTPARVVLAILATAFWWSDYGLGTAWVFAFAAGVARAAHARGRTYTNAQLEQMALVLRPFLFALTLAALLAWNRVARGANRFTRGVRRRLGLKPRDGADEEDVG